MKIDNQLYAQFDFVLAERSRSTHCITLWLNYNIANY